MLEQPNDWFPEAYRSYVMNNYQDDDPWKSKELNQLAHDIKQWANKLNINSPKYH